MSASCAGDHRSVAPKRSGHVGWVAPPVLSCEIKNSRQLAHTPECFVQRSAAGRCYSVPVVRLEKEAPQCLISDSDCHGCIRPEAMTGYDDDIARRASC